MNIILAVVVYLAGVVVYASPDCYNYFDILEVEQIEVDASGATRVTLQKIPFSELYATPKARSSFREEVPENHTDERIRNYTLGPVTRQVTVTREGVAIENLNTKKAYVFPEQLDNYHGEMAVDHKFWLMPHGRDEVVVWVFSRAQNNIARVKIPQGSDYSSYVYQTYGSIPILRLRFEVPSVNFGNVREVLVNLYTMKTLSEAQAREFINGAAAL